MCLYSSRSVAEEILRPAKKTRDLRMTPNKEFGDGTRTTPLRFYAVLISISPPDVSMSALRNTNKRKANNMGQPVVHFEIGCRDSGKTAAFFAQLFGWDMQAMGPWSTLARRPAR